MPTFAGKALTGRSPDAAVASTPGFHGYHNGGQRYGLLTRAAIPHLVRQLEVEEPDWSSSTTFLSQDVEVVADFGDWGSQAGVRGLHVRAVNGQRRRLLRLAEREGLERRLVHRSGGESLDLRLVKATPTDGHLSRELAFELRSWPETIGEVSFALPFLASSFHSSPEELADFAYAEALRARPPDAQRVRVELAYPDDHSVATASSTPDGHAATSATIGVSVEMTDDPEDGAPLFLAATPASTGESLRALGLGRGSPELIVLRRGDW